MASPKRPRKKRQQKKLRLFPYTQILASLLFIIAGAGILLYASGQKIVSITKHSPLSVQETASPLSKPAKLYIPKMSKVLYVSDGYVTGNRWTTSPIGVSYYTGSALPGLGNTVIYGHNTKDTLGGMWRVNKGDYIYIVLADGQFVKYQVSETKEITPDKVEILNQSADPRLTLYTCSGFLDQARFVVIANLVFSSYII